MFVEFLMQRYQHLMFAYNDEAEFRNHLLSGEVKVSTAEMIKAREDFEQQQQV